MGKPLATMTPQPEKICLVNAGLTALDWLLAHAAL
jgi:hypothetical protein